jgi:hypothetical protein
VAEVVGELPKSRRGGRPSTPMFSVDSVEGL